jgi:hypothetical protein
MSLPVELIAAHRTNAEDGFARSTYRGLAPFSFRTREKEAARARVGGIGLFDANLRLLKGLASIQSNELHFTKSRHSPSRT